VTCSEFFSLAKDLAVSGAAITGAIVAVKGLGTWKRQLKGQFEYELSRRILVTLFKYRDAIAGVRHPAMWGYEMPKPPAEEMENMSDADIHYYGTSKAYQARWDRVQTERTSLYADLLQSEALWGVALKDLFKALFSLEHELMVTIQGYLSMTNPAVSEIEKEALRNISAKRRDIMYDDQSEKGDSFKQEFQGALEEIEKYLKPKLQY
jgi:hypothetical protein